MDLDGDGRQDILSGSWDGDITAFRRNQNGTYAKGEQLKDSAGQTIDVGDASAAFAADWDGDGDLDLVVGNIQGAVQLASNLGTRTAPAYAAPTPLSAAGQPIMVGHGDSGPAVADWNGDGLIDLLVGGGDGSVTLFRNIGSQGKPELAAGETLVKSSASLNFSQENPDTPWGMRLKIAVTDYNGDGKLDLLAGDFATLAIPTRELTAEEKVLKANAEAAYNDAYARYDAFIQSMGGDYEKAMKEKSQEFTVIQNALMEASQEMQKYQTDRYEYRGNVWVFLRKDERTATGG